MDDTLVRVLLVGLAALVVVGAALATRRWQRPSHPQIDVAGMDLPDGIVIFTSTDCATCKEALGVVKSVGVPVREVTWELEPGLLESAEVTAVPLTVVLGSDDRVIDQMVGVPRRRRLRRATARWKSLASS